MITVLLMIHGLLAVTLLGAITHQAFSVVAPSATGKRSFFARFRNVNGAAYAGPIVLLFLLTAVGGALLYPQYRIDVRTTLEDLQFARPMACSRSRSIWSRSGWDAAGVLAVLADAAGRRQATSRRYLTWLLAFIVWWGFLIGHVLNNIKGLLP